MIANLLSYAYKPLSNIKIKAACTLILTSFRPASGFINKAQPKMSTAKYAKFDVAQFSCLDDNYGYLIHDPATGDTAAVDTPDARTYQSELDKRGWKLTHILK